MAPHHRLPLHFAHPAVGAAFDLGKTEEDYWKPVFAGYDFDKQWMKDAQARRDRRSSTTITRPPSASP